MILDLERELSGIVARDGVDFMVRGMLSADDRLFPLGTDSKVLSTVFELFIRPLVQEIGESHGYEVEEAKQTIYPDFTLLRDEADLQKIAIDVKTTYRKPKIDFTLGSYTSFMRNNTKNILYPYNQYAAHWIIGFVYTRHDTPVTKVCSLEERGNVYAPYTDVAWFVQEKYKISGERPGSGNTTNIGSIKSTDIDDFVRGEGPFADLGESVFRDYWANYGTTARQRPYRNVTEYQAWKRRSTRR